MSYIDADGHVEESPATFSDGYLDPAFAVSDLALWSKMEWLTGSLTNSCFPGVWGAAATI